MEAVPKSDIKSDIRFDISIKRTTWTGPKNHYLRYMFWNVIVFISHRIQGLSTITSAGSSGNLKC